ncbi:MAG: gamma-glutamyl-gamma-aminobutyrate hydrolase family protein [Alphaproteobacteria bacterium]|nr:gamma-glutamyl-gamma-aminobutyrate hydrolase family protein [Alphaproteobacteria bacterium]
MNSDGLAILVSQRVTTDTVTGERRDALDQNWWDFLHQAGLLPVAVPNRPEFAEQLIKLTKPRGILLTGGNDPVPLGGDAPERDETETFLISFALAHGLPLMGVCRGMQMVQLYFGVAIHPIEGHVEPCQTIEFHGRPAAVNSFHRFGTRDSLAPLNICGRSEDGVVKAVRVSNKPILGIMWHPERLNPRRTEDVSLFRDFFGSHR